MQQMEHIAILGNKGRYTSFSFGGKEVRFLSPSNLAGYRRVAKWDNGYIEAVADYGKGEEEEYIDLIPILENLFIEPKEFLAPIDKVEVANV